MEDAGFATAKVNLAYGHPGRGLFKTNVDNTANLLRHIAAIAGITLRCRRQMLVTTTQMRIGLRNTFDVMRKAAASKNNTMTSQS